MNPFEHPEFDNHEHVSFFSDPDAGLRAITAIHSTGRLELAGGGCRIWPYDSTEDALRDVLRLSRAMSYKLALAGLPAGGAKTVVIADPRTDNSEALLRALGKMVHRLGGRYVIAEDVGSTPADMEIIAKETPFVAGRSGGSGDTTTATAAGVLWAVRKGVERRMGRTDLGGLRVSIQGVGGVGSHLAKLLAADGAELVISDIDEEAVAHVAQQTGARVVAPAAIYDADVDVFSPCALGDVIGPDTVDRLRCVVVAGGANNQLVSADQAERLAERDILYVPDFVANMGGVLSAARMSRATDSAALADQTAIVAEVLDETFALADARGVSAHEAAVILASERIAAARTQRNRGVSLFSSNLWMNPYVARAAMRARARFADVRRLFSEG
jgi:leucine dehydrogenase